MNPKAGIALKLVSVLVFTLMSACIKAASPAVPAGETVFFRSFFALVPIVLYLAFQGHVLSALRTSHPFGHLWRGSFGSAAMALSFLALGLLPLSDAIAIGYASPLFATVLAALVLGETVRLYRWSAVAAGLIGVLVVLGPRLTVLGEGFATGSEAFGALAALAGAFLAAMAMIFVRKLVQVERTATIVVYFSIFAALASLLSLPFGWVVPTPREAALLVTAGLLGGFAQIVLTESYRHADASTIAPFEYASMLFGLALGYALFDEVPSLTMLAGAAVVVASGLFILYREHRLGLERARATKVVTPQG
jgi:drug/metabolite transporter (DMT)-like permease